MHQVIVPSLYLLSGICAYAAFNHAVNAFKFRVDRTQLIFAGLSLIALAYGITLAMTYHAESVASYVTALRWNLSSGALFLIFLIWFIANYAKVQSAKFLSVLITCLTVLFVVNQIEPFTLQYATISSINYLQLPWGEPVARAVGHNSNWFYLAVPTVLSVYGYTAYALIRRYRQDHFRTTFCMLCAIAIMAICSSEGLLVRVSIIDFIHLGGFGYLAMVIVMSIALSYEAQLQLRASENRFRSLIEQSPFSIQVMSTDGKTQLVNNAWEKLWGVSAQAVIDYNITRDQQLVEKGVMPYIKTGFAGQATEIPPIIYNPAENTVLKGPPGNRWVRAFIYPIKDAYDKVCEVILMHEDVTEKKRVEDAIRNIAAGVSAETGEKFFQALVSSLAKLFDAQFAFIGIIDKHDDRRVNTLAICKHHKISGNINYSLADTPCANVIGKQTCIYPRNVQNQFPQDQMLAKLDAQSYIGTPLFNTNNEPLGLIAVLDKKPLEQVKQAQEILEIFAARASSELQRLSAEADIRRMAFEDYLTGLASRAYLHQRLTEELNRARKSKEYGALILIDLDHFKTINDALSHDIGDEVLRAVGRRLSEVVSNDIFLARFGGDEFIALSNTQTTDLNKAKDSANDLSQSIMNKLMSPIFVNDRPFTVGASIGIVVFPEKDETELDILRHADMALYRAKNQGRGNIQFYLPDLLTAATSRLHLEEGLRHVIANRELRLHFQPQVDNNGNMIGAEALLRWRHPEMGDISPTTFIHVAEETGLIHPIGRWVLDQACGKLKSWLNADIPFHGHLSINVCPWQFVHTDFVSLVQDCISQHQIDPHWLMLELTETALLYDLEDTIAKLKTLRSLGIKISMDDFGTGYSSLAYLKDLPLDQIKIDRAFISELNATDKHPLVETMISIGRHMHLDVIAEGVETKTQCEILVELGCINFQGYYFSIPLPEAEFSEWICNRYGSSAQATTLT